MPQQAEEKRGEGNGQPGCSNQHQHVLIRGHPETVDVTPMVPVQTKPSWRETESLLPRTPLAGQMSMEGRRGDDDDMWAFNVGHPDPLISCLHAVEESVDEAQQYTKSTMKHVPLAVALLNLQCLHLGAGLYYEGSWVGCNNGPWCSLNDGHDGGCNTRATVPGPAAYLPEELASVGLSPSGPWLDTQLSEAAVKLAATAKGMTLQQASPSSSMSHIVGSRQKTTAKQPTRSSTRRRVKKRMDDFSCEQTEHAYQDGGHLSDEHESTMTDEVQLHASSMVEDSGRTRGKAPRGQAVHVTRSKRASARKSMVTSAVQKSKRGGRNVSRRAPQVWISGEVKDPRTGEMITDVPPATFCTQCEAVSTPVWRAGPFGHKTLCNACGVRWMKFVPKKK